jgi:hypothetical protein
MQEPKATGVSIYGNCQADAMLKVLLQAPDFAKTFTRQELAPCFAIEGPRLQSWAQDVAPSVGLFIHQRLRKGWRRDEVFDTDWLASHLPEGARVLEWSDMYYKGYEPYMSYPLTFARVPPDDYLNLLHMLAFVHERPWQDVIPLYTRPDTLPEPLMLDIHRLCVEELVKREADCTIRIAPFIAQSWQSERLFLSFNHPARATMRHAADQVLKYLGLVGPIPEKAWYVFPETACQPLFVCVSAQLQKPAPDPLQSPFLLGTRNVSMKEYFESWEAALTKIGRAQLLKELLAQTQNSEIVGPVLRQAAQIMSIGDPLKPARHP